MSDAVKRCFDVRITVGQRTIFMDGNTGFFGMVDIHAHFCSLFAADLVFSKRKAGFFTTFYRTKALPSVFFQKMIGDT